MKFLVKRKYYLLLIFILTASICFYITSAHKASGVVNQGSVSGNNIIGPHVYIKDREGIPSTINNSIPWDTVKISMNDSKERLTKNAMPLLSDSLPADLNPLKKPEGQAWIHQGDMNISSDATVVGKGTIIVNSGSLIISKNISYSPTDSNASLGFIVSGDITIKNSVQKLIGAYYSPNVINIE